VNDFHHLERRIADLEHAHAQKIEALRSDLAHFQDRGRRANELEFDAASKIWHAYVDAYIKTPFALGSDISVHTLQVWDASSLGNVMISTPFTSPLTVQSPSGGVVVANLAIMLT
jgi:hypothetical protein